ncbi:VOC family protein [Lentzea sp. HUAS12]|uniref:VOC family protein n=1 Tax=Lentzea sp. HUAS12 TaxID=2951806 RepID=UPI0020A22953|nr:VOC family protein [Lentzea sp. HUAS12]USX54392.1 VOC family protein [Lentzea sp. HUAS12]
MSRVVHFEIPVDEPRRAAAFYRAVFGWQAQDWGGADYWPMATGEQPGVGPGAEGALTPRAEAPEGVLVYVAVDDVDAAVKSAEHAGGSVVTGKTAIPSIGWSAHVRDSEGNLIGLFQSDESAPAGA